jgi:HEAT repeat protein
VSIGRSFSETLEIAHAQLVIIANESPESRRSVIAALIPVLNDPKKEFDLAEVERWRIAVGILGELKATEAIDDLVRNINWTSYESRPHPHPPVRTALVRIGKPAVARLLRALLSDPNEFFRGEVSEALSEIGEPSVEGLLEVLAGSVASARVGAAQALARIGGVRAREAIVLALSVETDEETKEQLESAVRYIDHVECLNDSSKCK